MYDDDLWWVGVRSATSVIAYANPVIAVMVDGEAEVGAMARY